MGSKKTHEILSKVVIEFVKEFPEYKADLQEHIDFLDEIEAYVFFPDVFRAHIEPMLKENIEIDKLKALFSFFEHMASSSNDDIVNLLILTVLDDMRDDPVVLENGKSLCGQRCLKELEDLLNWTPEIVLEEKAQKKKKKQRKKTRRKEQGQTQKRMYRNR